MGDYKQITIMIVDDSPVNLKLLADLLRGRGYRVVAFLRGSMALDAAIKNPPDLIILDIRMPEMDGFEVARRLKADAALKHVPVLFISALAEVDDKVRAFSVGAVDYVTKPFQPQELFARVETHLNLCALLRESEERNRVLIEELPDLVLRFDRAGRHLVVSRRLKEISQREPSEFIGKTHRELGFSPKQVVFWEESISRVFETGEILEMEMVFGQHVSPLFYNLRLVPERNLRGEIQSVLAIGRNVTAQKLVEQAMVQAKEKAEAANRTKSEFLANISHELRTPLNGIIGMMQLLQSTVLDEEQQRYLSISLRSADRLTQLLSDLVDISRVESGMLEIVSKPFSLRKLSDSVLDLFSVTALDKGVTLECAMDWSLPSIVVGDEARLRQILFNLLGNALKFTEKGNVNMEIILLSVDWNGKLRVLFSVVDTGIGISEERLKALFNPFVQADGSYTRKYQGAGLGLAIVRRLVELMGGHVSIESAPDVGTTVHFVLPFALPPGFETTDGT